MYINECLYVYFTGTPPEKFVFEFYNKDKAYNNLGPLTPQEFYNKHVRPLFNVDDKVCDIHIMWTFSQFVCGLNEFS